MREIFIYLLPRSESRKDGDFLASHICNSLVQRQHTVEWFLDGEKRTFRAFQCQKDDFGATVVTFREVVS